MTIKGIGKILIIGFAVLTQTNISHSDSDTQKFQFPETAIEPYIPINSFSLIGLKSGLSMADAIATSATRGYNLNIQPETYKGTSRGASIAVEMNSEGLSDRLESESADELLVKFSSPLSGSRVVSVSLTQRFDSQNAVLLSTEIQSLVSIYGPPSEITQAGARWLLDLDGAPLDRDDGECYVYEHLTFYLSLEGDTPPDDGFEIQCAAHFSVRRWVDETGSIWLRKEFADHVLIRKDSSDVSESVKELLN